MENNKDLEKEEEQPEEESSILYWVFGLMVIIGLIIGAVVLYLRLTAKAPEMPNNEQINDVPQTDYPDYPDFEVPVDPNVKG